MNNELIPLEQTGINLAVRGAEIPKDLTFDQAQNAVALLTRLGSTAKWGLADLISVSMGRWGEQYSQLIDATQMSRGALANLLYVWRVFPTIKSRKWDLSVGHYVSVCPSHIEQGIKESILQQAVDEGLSRDEVREIVKGYGPNIITPKFSKESFVNRFQALIDWADRNDAPEDLMRTVRELLTEFKQDSEWDF